jgi:hypothetical protein
MSDIGPLSLGFYGFEPILYPSHLCIKKPAQTIQVLSTGKMKREGHGPVLVIEPDIRHVVAKLNESAKGKQGLAFGL